MANNIYRFTINHQPFTLTLTLPKQWGQCFRCQIEKSLWLISEKQIYIGTTPTFDERKFCWSCSLADLYELEQSDCKFENKAQIIKEIREILWASETSDKAKEDQELLECYG
jgi:hypothetical protein